MSRAPKVAKAALAPPTRQAIKSEITRTRLIDATIKCLVNYGYAKTTTLKVAEVAGLSRGAMMHHFENGAALIYATATELHERRLRAHIKRALEVDHDRTDTLIQQSWQQFTSPNFIAFLELAMAARTDPELASILVPLQRDYTSRWHRQAIDLYPEWGDTPAEFNLAFWLSLVTMQGMAVSLLTSNLQQDMVGSMLKHLEKQIRALRPPKRKS